MMRTKGIALDKLLIGIIAVSVASTAIWNYQIRSSEMWVDPALENQTESRIKYALDDIKYHLTLAGYEYGGKSGNYTVERGQKSDIIKIRHGGVNVEYLVEKNNNLIRRTESVEKVIAENISSIRSLNIGQNSVAITLSGAPYSHGRAEAMETMSKSYSIIVELKNL